MRSQLLVGDVPDLYGTWSQSSSIWSLTFKVICPQYLKCALFFFLLPSLHNVHSLQWIFVVGIQAEFEVYGLMGMCNLALRE